MEWKQTIRETAGKAAHEAQKLAKIAKLNLRILSEEDKIKKAQVELGKICHQDYVSGTGVDASAYLPWHEKIDAAEAQIAALRAEIDALKAEDAAVTVEYVEVEVEAEPAAQPDEAPADCCGGECACDPDCGCDTDCSCDTDCNCGTDCCGSDEQSDSGW